LSTNGNPGTANLGGGGGGSGRSASVGGNGGSGVVIISYVGAQQFGGGNVTSVGGNTIHTFTTSGTLSPLSSLTAQYLVVAGGGGGGSAWTGGGGGAGGMLTGTGVTIDTNSNYVVTVGAGGSAATNGSNSSWSMVSTAAVGGGFGVTDNSSSPGGNGGSGGGNGYNVTTAGGSGTSGQGNNGGGGSGWDGGAGTVAGGGGGGKSAAGANGAFNAGGAGGAGAASSISGSSVTYAGGGGGGSGGGSAGAGGAGGGGGGALGSNASGTAGTANTGGGGGGAAKTSGTGGTGGSGVVIIAYPGSTQQMAGGTVTISGGNVIHTFTSSGYLTPIKYASRSLRFRASASAYLNRTFGSTGNTKTWTWSGWVKRGVLGTKQNIFGQVDLSVANRQCYVSFETDNTLSFRNYTVSGYDYQLFTTQVFRDPSAWYHLVIVSDTTQATSTNRLKIYVNGAQVTAFGTASYPSQNFDGWINANAGSGVQLGIGRAVPYNTTEYVDGYMTEVNFVDGAALTPSSFGTFNSYGVWQPITYGGSYGTNGFYLTFGNNTSTTTLGYDTSPQGNNWTTNNISVTAGVTYDSMTDVPTLTSATVANYATGNPVYADPSGSVTYTNGNLTWSCPNGGSGKSTISVTTGKFYWEAVYLTNAFILGVSDVASVGRYNNTILYQSDGTKGINGTFTSYGATYTTGDVIGIALDMTGGTVTFYKNNASQGSISLSLAPITNAAAIVIGGGGFSNTGNLNFGQQPFTYTPPSGFVALNTYNLSTPTIPNGAVYMAATTYTGTGASLTVANTVNGTNFQPDLVWVKSRSAATDHKLTDVVRGVTKALISDTTGAETTDTNGLTAFGSTGFTLGTDTTYNNSAATYVAWQWKANGAGVTNTSGSITSTVSANTTAGFVVVTFTGTGANATVGHGLGVAPSMVIVKDRTAARTGYQWPVWHTSLGGGTKALFLNVTDATATDTVYWNSTVPTSSVFSVGTWGGVNYSGDNFVAYCFSAVAGYSAFGSYTGNGSTDGPFVFCGFRPRFVLVKNASTAGKWVLMDTSRGLYNEMTGTNALYPNLADAEGTDGGSRQMDFLSNGFKLRCTGGDANGSGNTIIYMAFAENPFKYSNAR
jgi:hypothetical protein